MKIYDEEHRPSARTALEPKGEMCKVVGYSMDTDAYKVVSNTGKLLIRKDVIVDENWTVTRDHKQHRRDVLSIAKELEVATLSQDDSEIRVAASIQAAPEPRRSNRVTKPPDRLTFAAESDTAVTLPPTPRNIAEAVQSKHKVEWLKSINAEMGEIIARKVIEPLAPGEVGGKAFGSKIAFRVTKNVNPLLDDMLKFKSRMVALGYSSIFGVHYDKSYSPTILFKSLLVVLTIAKLEGWVKTNIDIGNAYLEATLKRVLYMYLPLDWTRGKRIKVKLARNLYGLKDAGLMWYMLIDKVIRGRGYTRSIYDPCIYFKFDPQGKLVSIIALFVDDMTLTGSKAEEVNAFKKIIADTFKKITDMGELTKFLGIEIAEDSETDQLILSQLDTTNQYIDLHLKNSKAVKFVPIVPSHILDKAEEDEDTEANVPIWELVGKIRYLADRTRHDLLYVASKLGTKSASASPKYQKAAEDALVYINTTKKLSLRLGGVDKQIRLFGYADASFIADQDSKSQLGYCFFLNRDSGAVCAKSIKDKTVSMSSTEAEIKALVEAIKEAIWLRGLLGR